MDTQQARETLDTITQRDPIKSAYPERPYMEEIVARIRLDTIDLADAVRQVCDVIDGLDNRLSAIDSDLEEREDRYTRELNAIDSSIRAAHDSISNIDLHTVPSLRNELYSTASRLESQINSSRY